MMSSVFSLDPKQEASADFISTVGRELQKLFAQRAEETGVTQQALADRLGVDRSRVNRCLNGFNNLTLESLAEIAWALDADPQISFIDLCEGADWKTTNFVPITQNSPVLPKIRSALDAPKAAKPSNSAVFYRS